MYPNTNILYLDADAVMKRPPELFTRPDFDYDFAVPFVTDQKGVYRLSGNTMFFGTSPLVDELLKVWKSKQVTRNLEMILGKFKKPYYEAWDQQALQDVLPTVEGLHWLKLPHEYGRIMPHPSGFDVMKNVNPQNVVIEQHQASRQNRQTA